MKNLLQIIRWIFFAAVIFLAAKGVHWAAKWIEERSVLKQVIERLSADSRIAEVLVTQSRFNEETKAIETTIKFLEYNAKGEPLEPKFFTFQGNIIQFQALVIRFQDQLVQAGDKIRGKSAYIFLKAFILDKRNTQVFDITDTHQIPSGYKIPGAASEYEQKLWEEFWNYALDPQARERMGIKNAQIEAPGSMFLPGTIYTLRIEHDGGLRIDTQPIPQILKGEKI